MTITPAPLRRPGSLFSLERLRSDRRVTWLTVVGLLLVPLVIGGLLVWALWNPTERLDTVKAAVVNLDKPVTVNGQTVPLGRQLSAGLLNGKHDNFQWVLTDQKDAEAGAASGEYVAVVTIPSGFSKAATSPAGPAADAHQATIDVQTSEKSKLVDPAISQAVTTAATGVLNKQLTSTYIENVYVGFNTLHDQIAKAASGATQLSSGVSQLASGTHQLADAAGQLAAGASGASSGVSQLADGTSSLAAGVSQLSGGASSLAGGLATLNDNVQSPQTGLVASTSQLAAGASGVSSGVNTLANKLGDLHNACVAMHGAADPICAGIAQTQAGITTGQGGNPGLGAAAAGVADGNQKLAAGMPALTGGIAQSASGAAQLASGASSSADGAQQLSSGAASAATGVSQLSDGVTQLAAGIPPLATGADQSAAGAASLASGLNEAAAKLPSYSSGDRTNLAAVASQPVTTRSAQSTPFGTSSIPLFGAVALWLGALATFLVLQAVSRRSLLTTRASGRIAFDGFLPAAVIGAVQGVLVAGIMQFALGLDPAHWLGFAGVAVLAGVAFAAVNHGLVALLGGVGQFLSMLVVVITLASGLVSTVPSLFDGVMQWLPTSPAITALQGVVASTDGVWRGVGGLLLWAAFGFLLALAAVARRRIVGVAQLLPAE